MTSESNWVAPGVSVVVPMRNAETFIEGTLRSILVEQKVPLEVIVVDDNSTDNSAVRVKSLADRRIRLLQGPGRGIAACLNVGFEAASAALVMRCDADDRYPLLRIHRQVEWLQAHPQFDAVCGSFATVDPQGRLIGNLETGSVTADITEELLSGISRTSLCTFAIRNDLARKNKGFREYFETAEDLDYQFRLAEVGRIAYAPEVNYLYRIHSSSITHSEPSDRRAFFESAARQFCADRRRVGFDPLQQGSPPEPPSRASRVHTAAAVDHIQGLWLGKAWMEHRAGNNRGAITAALRAVTANPKSIPTWRSFLALIFRVINRR